jgi:hypothetical protein
MPSRCVFCTGPTPRSAASVASADIVPIISSSANPFPAISVHSAVIPSCTARCSLAYQCTPIQVLRALRFFVAPYSVDFFSSTDSPSTHSDTAALRRGISAGTDNSFSGTSRRRCFKE